jgi:hypothetical protein
MCITRILSLLSGSLSRERQEKKAILKPAKKNPRRTNATAGIRVSSSRLGARHVRRALRVSRVAPVMNSFLVSSVIARDFGVKFKSARNGK